MEMIDTYSLEDIGHYVAQSRKAAGYTQNDFAELLGTSHATLSSLENGKPVSSALVLRSLQILGKRIRIISKAQISKPQNSNSKVSNANS